MKMKLAEYGNTYKTDKNAYCKFIPDMGVQINYLLELPLFEELKKEDPVKYNMLCSFNFSKKTIYMNIGEEIAQYINYFEKFYDNSGRLSYLYAHINRKIISSGAVYAESVRDASEFIDPYPQDKFMKDLMNLFLNTKIMDSVTQLVEDNYFEFDMMKKKVTSSKNTAIDAVQFTSDHAKACLRFAVASKLIIPLIGQYAEYRLQRTQITGFFMACFKLLLHKVSKECNIEVKLLSMAKLAVEQTKNSDRTMWDKMEVCEGGTKHNKIPDIMKHLVQNMPKIVFDKSLVAYFHNIAKKQVAFLFKQKFVPIVALDETRDEDGLSDFDKVEINIIKDDESKSILNDKNSELTLKNLEKFYGKIPQEELDFYMEYIKPEDIKDLQRSLLFYIFAKDFGGLKQMYSLNYEGYIKLICIAKRKLKPYGLVYIPQFISAKMNKVNTRKTINTMLLKKLESSPQYMELLEKKYKNTQLLVDGKSIIVTILSKFMNTPMFIIDYDLYKERGILLNTLEISADIMIDEFIKTVDMI